MADNTAERPLTAEEIELAKQAAMADSKSKIAKAAFEEAEAKKKLEALNQPPGQKELAAEQEAIAVSNQKAIQAARDSWKGPDIKALEGSIAAEGTFIESQIIAGHTLSMAMIKLINAMHTKRAFANKPLSLVIYNATDIPAMELYANMLLQLADLKNCFDDANAYADNLLNPSKQVNLAGGAAPMLVASAAAGIVRTVVDVLSLFRKDTAYKNFDVTIDETSLVASFVQAIDTKEYKWTIFYPAVYPIDTINAASTNASPLISSLNQVRQLNADLLQKINSIDQQLATFQTALAAETDASKKQELNDQVNIYQKVKDTIQSLPLMFIQLETTLSTADATTKIPLLSSLVRAERIVTKLSGTDNAYVIKLMAVSKGSHRIVKSLFHSAKINFSGGTELSCLVFGKDGHVVFGKNIHEYLPYMNAESIRDLLA